MKVNLETSTRVDDEDDTMITSQSDIQRGRNHEGDSMLDGSATGPKYENIKKTISPNSFSKLHERIPTSSYLSKRVTTDGELQRESKKTVPTRPLSANSALAFISDHEQKYQKLKDAPKSLHKKDSSLSKTQTSTLQQGACLTNPNEPMHNNGYDNVDGNLIVHENDVIKPQSKCTYLVRGYENHRRNEYCDVTSFRILHLLGQGTFAQVFKCEDARSGNHVALKIIKNKPAYTNQALIEIEIFETLNRQSLNVNPTIPGNQQSKRNIPNDPFVHLLCYFMYRSHLCLVFELLGTNLYEILKRRQFRGLPLAIVRDFMRQALDGMNILSKTHVIHCDLKPENILLVKEHSPEFMNTVGSTSSSVGTSDTALSIKLIDFGSACFEGQFSHTYIQSRFYRSPEVLLGIDYDSAIDVWSLGCVAAELLLGLPLLPGLNEHDQLTRICEMIGNIPDWMIENGTKGLKHFVREPKNSFPSQTSDLGPLHRREDGNVSSWRLMSSNDYYTSLSEEEKEKISIGKSTHRYFKRKLLGDIISLHARVNTAEDKDNLPLFIHLLTGMLNIDPWNRFTAYQASTHPFLTGIRNNVPASLNDVASMYSPLDSRVSTNISMFWKPPWDPSVTRRKLLMAQKSRNSQSFDRCNDDYIVTESSALSSTGHKAISNASTGFPIQSNRFSLYSNLKQGSHPNLHALYQSSLETQISIPHVSHQEFYGSFRTGGALPPPQLYNSGYYPHTDEDVRIHHPASSKVLPQSFSGVYYDPFHPIVPGDLGHALQRPGVLPLGGDAGVHHDLQQIPQHQLLHTRIPANALIRSGSLASLQGDYRQWSYRNRHSTSQRNYPSSYSDVYMGHLSTNSGTVISPVLAVQPVPLYHPVTDYGMGQGITKMTNSLLAQQLSEYSATLPVIPQSSYQTNDGNALSQNVNGPLYTQSSHIS